MSPGGFRGNLLSSDVDNCFRTIADVSCGLSVLSYKPERPFIQPAGYGYQGI
jgi:hypothetical protein